MSSPAAHAASPAALSRTHQSTEGPGSGYSGHRQFLALLALNLRQLMFSRYIWVLLVVGGLPVVLAGLYFIRHLFIASGDAPFAEINSFFQLMFRTLYIHFIIFFIANIFGFALLRKELDDRTLHYLYLQPVSRLMILFSKFASFLVLTWTYLSVTFILTYVLLLAPYGAQAVVSDLFENRRAFSLIQALGVMFVALMAYGSISMVMGSLFKSGGYGALLLAWETGLPYLPSTMKSFTVSNYLQALSPERGAISRTRIFELLGTPPAYWECALAIAVVLVVFLSLSALIINLTECRYSDS
ncbi:MAG: hypothetical protein Kow0059_14010 [Candidatus Sumerlaeia bacterium]